MKKSWILVVDSGMGGMWTLEHIKRILPNENYLFFMDRVHSPYGNKSLKTILKIAKNNMKKILKVFDVKLVVLACNTLSSIAFECLKNAYPNLPIIPISPFVDLKKIGKKPTLLLATKNTIKHNIDIKKYKNLDCVKMCGFGNLAKKIDKNMQNLDVLMPFLSKKLKIFQKNNIKNILLGCTHFGFLKQQFKKIFGNDVQFFENSDLVAKQVKTVLTKKHLTNKNCIHETLTIFKI